MTTPLWIRCLFVSVAAHLAIGGYLYYNPMILQSPLESLFGITLATSKPLPHESDADLIRTNLLLEEVFHTIHVTPSQLHPPYDLDAPSQGIALAPQEEAQAGEPLQPAESSSWTALIDPHTLQQEAILTEMQELSPSPLFQALEEQAKSVSHLQLDAPLTTLDLPFVEPLKEIAYEDLPALMPRPQEALTETAAGLRFQEQPIDVGARHEHFLTAEKPLLAPSENTQPLFAPQAAPIAADTKLVEFPAQPHFENYTFPKLPPSALWNDDFEVAVNVAPNPQGPGYLFALKLNPTHDLSHHKLKHNFYFLLDRSSSSKQRRFSVFKRATLKALACIQPEDTFNIFVLDKQITPLSPHNLNASLKNKRAAEEFLDAQESHLSFNNGNIYNTLKQILPSIPADTQMHTAILLTDGQSGMTPKKKQHALNTWLQNNQERVTLYTAAVGKDNDLILLDLLSSESGGKLLYSDTHASFPRKLAKLILDLKQPLAKQIDVSVTPRSRAHISLFPNTYALPPLYANEPYVILGTTDTLEPFELLIEGRHGEDWIGIKKKITFDHALAADPGLVKQWKKTQASVCYTKFLEEGKTTHLKEAKEILNLAQKEISFQ